MDANDIYDLTVKRLVMILSILLKFDDLTFLVSLKMRVIHDGAEFKRCGIGLIAKKIQ